MIRRSLFRVAFAGATAAAGCASPANHLEYGTHESGWQDAGTPGRPISIDRLASYYVDENGDLWDDRGRKYQGKP